MDNEKNGINEQEWEQIIESSRKGNNKMMNLFSLNRNHVESFTERFRKEAGESITELERMKKELQAAVQEVLEAKKRAFQALPNTACPPRPERYRRVLSSARGRGIPTWYLIGQDGTKRVSLVWHYMYAREENMKYIQRDIRMLFKDTEDLLTGMIGLTEVVDQMAGEGMNPNQLLWYEEEFKNHTRRINDIYRQINMAAFHLYGTLAKEKEVIVNIRLGEEHNRDILRHHQAVLWAYNQYFQYRMTGNQYLGSALEALDSFIQVIRKEVMRRKVETLHINAKAVSLERMEAAHKQREEELARKELGDDYWSERVESERVENKISQGIIQSNLNLNEVPVPSGGLSEIVEKEETEMMPEVIEDEEEKRSIFPLIILALILIGVGLYYFKDKW